MKGTIVVTGSNGGLGSAIATRIVQSYSEYHGIFIVRKVETATTLNSIVRKVPHTFKYDTVAIDLSSLASVREGAKTINQRVAEGSIPPIRALIISAGFAEMTTQSFTPDGFDMTFQVNYLSQFLLVLLLLQSMDKQNGRIVIVSGQNHDPEDSRNDMQGLFNGLEDKNMFHDTESLAKGTWSSSLNDPSPLAGARRYGAAHLLEVMMMYEFQERLSRDPALSNISVLGVDPGAMATDITRRDGFLVRVVIMKLIMPLLSPIFTYFWPNGFLRTTTKSAADVLRAAFDTETLGPKPKAVYLNGTDPWPTNKEARDEAKRTMLWKDSVKYCSIVDEDTALVNWE